MYYVILEAESVSDLQDKVNLKLANGAQLVGGVAVCVVHTETENSRKGYMERITEYTYAQAIIVGSRHEQHR